MSRISEPRRREVVKEEEGNTFSDVIHDMTQGRHFGIYGMQGGIAVRWDVFMFLALDPNNDHRFPPSRMSPKELLKGRLYWCKIGQRVASVEHSIGIVDVRDVFLGKHTRALSSPAAREARANCCVSLITAKERLDLEAESPLVLQHWISAINTIKKHAGRRVVHDSQRLDESRGPFPRSPRRLLPEERRRRLSGKGKGKKGAPPRVDEESASEDGSARGSASSVGGGETVAVKASHLQTMQMEIFALRTRLEMLELRREDDDVLRQLDMNHLGYKSLPMQRPMERLTGPSLDASGRVRELNDRDLPMQPHSRQALSMLPPLQQMQPLSPLSTMRPMIAQHDDPMQPIRPTQSAYSTQSLPTMQPLHEANGATPTLNPGRLPAGYGAPSESFASSAAHPDRDVYADLPMSAPNRRAGLRDLPVNVAAKPATAPGLDHKQPPQNLAGMAGLPTASAGNGNGMPRKVVVHRKTPPTANSSLSTGSRMGKENFTNFDADSTVLPLLEPTPRRQLFAANGAPAFVPATQGSYVQSKPYSSAVGLTSGVAEFFNKVMHNRMQNNPELARKRMAADYSKAEADRLAEMEAAGLMQLDVLRAQREKQDFDSYLSSLRDQEEALQKKRASTLERRPEPLPSPSLFQSSALGSRSSSFLEDLDDEEGQAHNPHNFSSLPPVPRQQPVQREQQRQPKQQHQHRASDLLQSRNRYDEADNHEVLYRRYSASPRNQNRAMDTLGVDETERYAKYAQDVLDEHLEPDVEAEVVPEHRGAVLNVDGIGEVDDEVKAATFSRLKAMQLFDNYSEFESVFEEVLQGPEEEAHRNQQQGHPEEHHQQHDGLDDLNDLNDPNLMYGEGYEEGSNFVYDDGVDDYNGEGVEGSEYGHDGSGALAHDSYRGSRDSLNNPRDFRRGNVSRAHHNPQQISTHEEY